ncbi:DNA polymerase-like protein subunit delta-2, partial [Morchella snyderi]
MASSSGASQAAIDALMRAPDSTTPHPTPTRLQRSHAPHPRFHIPTRTYQQQFSTTYFLRLASLKPHVDAAAHAAWSAATIAGERVHHCERVLDVRPRDLCWVSGTVYMDMALKPNILDDITKDHWIAAPPPREKYTDPAHDRVMLEDESGRLRLVGGILRAHGLVTGCVVAVMGSETKDGDFEVLDLIIPDLPPQPHSHPQSQSQPQSQEEPCKDKGKLVLCSGLSFRGGLKEPFTTDLLSEWLLGELGNPPEQATSSTVVRLVLAGNSFGAPLAVPAPPAGTAEKAKKYGYDASTYDPAPARALDDFLAQLLPSLHVTVMPGAADPANVSLPQQPLHPALFGAAKAYGGSTFERATNPWAACVGGGVGEGEGEGGVLLLGTSGQVLDDVYKYVEGDDRLVMAERLLRWRVVAPTAPDTLWAYPFNEQDPFVLDECPHVFFIGNQDRFETRLVEGGEGQRCRVVLVPRFAETGEVVVVHLGTLEVEVVRFQLREGE